MKNYIDIFSSYVTSKLVSKNWKLKSIVFYIFITMVFQIPRFGYLINYLTHEEISTKYDAILLQKESPFIHHDYGVGNHEGSMEFRIFVPLLMKFFSLNILLVYIVQVLIGVLVLYLMLGYIYKSTNNRLIAFIYTLGFVFVYVGSSNWIDVYGFYDSFAYAFILFAFFSSNPILIFFLVLSSLYIDERAYLASIGIIIFQIFNQKKLNVISSVCLALIVGFLIRVYLNKYCGMFLYSNQLLAKDTFLSNINNIGLATITVFKGFWVVFVICIMLLIVYKRYFYLVSLAAYFGMLYFSSFIVYDMTRSISYLVLMFPITHTICNKYLRGEVLLKLYILVAFMGVIIPTYMVQKEIYFVYPIIFDFVKLILK